MNGRLFKSQCGEKLRFQRGKRSRNQCGKRFGYQSAAMAMVGIEQLNLSNCWHLKKHLLGILNRFFNVFIRYRLPNPYPQTKIPLLLRSNWFYSKARLCVAFVHHTQFLHVHNSSSCCWSVSCISGHLWYSTERKSFSLSSIMKHKKKIYCAAVITIEAIIK